MINLIQNNCTPSKLLTIELEQSRDEGKEVAVLQQKALLIATSSTINTLEREQYAIELFSKLHALPVANNYSYLEPSDWQTISNSINPVDKIDRAILNTNQENLVDKIYGGILGKCIGCLLGKPVEGWSQHKILSFLRATANFPIAKYLFDSINNQSYEKYELSKNWIFPITGMPEDDDVNYLLIAFKIIQKYGNSFTPIQVAETWLNLMPIFSLCTAERIAYRNFINGISPPESASYCNPYREWIGAQIRADLFGYICPGKPMLAMELAWKDASISHVKNGIYGALWIAVMIALIPIEHFESIVSLALKFIPPKTRFYQAISNVLDWYASKISVENVLAKVHKIFSEKNIHHWCHVIPNAMIVAIALLWGKKDFLFSLQITLVAGFDTDSNGATVGSILGYTLGAKLIPDYWKNALQNCIYSSIAYQPQTDIKNFAEKVGDFVMYRDNI